MTEFGNYQELVEEVLKFAQYGQFFSPDFDHPQGVYEISDFEEARKRAWEETYGEEEYLWTDIRELQMREVRRLSYSISDFDHVREKLSALLGKLTLYVARGVTGDYSDVVDDIIADLYNCAFSRAVSGTRNSFFEKIYEVYKKGGWPCGWKGEYPAGLMVVYFPSKPGRSG